MSNMISENYLLVFLGKPMFCLTETLLLEQTYTAIATAIEKSKKTTIESETDATNYDQSIARTNETQKKKKVDTRGKVTCQGSDSQRDRIDVPIEEEFIRKD